MATFRAFIELVTVYDVLYVKSKCLPEMCKDRVYCVQMTLQNSSADIIGAECGCPAGRGPTGSCKHIGALSYVLADFIRFRASPDYQTCTYILKQWNHPRARKVEPVSVHQLGNHRSELLPSKVCAKGSQMVYDPHSLHLRQPDPQAVETLRCDLLAIYKPCGFTNIIVPSVEKIRHDHTYATQLGVMCNGVSDDNACSSGQLPVVSKPTIRN